VSLKRCLDDLRAKGVLDPARAAQYRTLFDDLEPVYRRQFGDQAADAMVSDEVLKVMAAEIALKERQALLQIKAQQGIRARLVQAEQAGARTDRVALAYLDAEEGVKGVRSVWARYRAHSLRAHSRMEALLRLRQRDLLGRLKPEAQFDAIVREAFHEATGDASARELAEAWTATAETLRQRYNAAGGSIAKRADWGLPQVHDSLKVRQAGFRAWRDAILPLLAPERMIDEVTGRAISPPRLELALRGVWEAIRTQGWDSRTAGGAGLPKLASRHMDHRFLVFKDADSWLAYQRAFGEGSVLDAMLGHIDQMARDLAAIEVLGPNPAATLRWLGDELQQRAALADTDAKTFERARDRAQGAAAALQSRWRVFTGEINRPVSAKLGRFFAGARSVQVASKLGSATLSAVTDLGFAGSTRLWNGLPVMTMARDLLRQFNPLDDADRRLAVQAGLGFDEAASRMGALWRYEDQANTPELLRRTADWVLRASLLSAWTQAGKHAFGLEVLASLARVADQPLDGLDAGLRRMLERYGIGAERWDLIRATPLYEHRGARLLRPDELADRTDLAPGVAEDLALNLLEMITVETRFAVPESTLAARAVTTANTQAGTWMGEIVRSVMQFKGFPVTIIMTHLRRMVLGQGAVSRAHYAAAVIVSTTVLGALAIQMRQIALGRDPRPMDDPLFWNAALLQSGGLGLFGDFLFAEQNRYGGGMASTLAGPIAGTTFELGKATVGNLQQWASEEETNAGREIVKLVQANWPGASLWYARLAFDRLLFNTLQRWVDPEHDQHWRRMERRARADMGQGFWWRPGEMTPARAPDYDNALEDRP
jgi:hypothetical protein